MSIIWDTDFAYMVTLFGTYDSQLIINRFCMDCQSVTDANETPDDFLEDWATKFMPSIRGLANQGVTYTKVQVYNLGHPYEGTFERTLNLGGTNGTGDTSDYAPVMLSASFRLYTEVGISRSGWKRFTGMLQSQIVGSGLTWAEPSDFGDSIADFKTEVLSLLTTGAGNEFKMKVWGKHPTEAGFTVYDIVSVADPFLGTQNSRKLTHGD